MENIGVVPVKEGHQKAVSIDFGTAFLLKGFCGATFFGPDILPYTPTGSTGLSYNYLVDDHIHKKDALMNLEFAKILESMADKDLTETVTDAWHQAEKTFGKECDTLGDFYGMVEPEDPVSFGDKKDGWDTRHTFTLSSLQTRLKERQNSLKDLATEVRIFIAKDSSELEAIIFDPDRKDRLEYCNRMLTPTVIPCTQCQRGHEVAVAEAKTEEAKTKAKDALANKQKRLAAQEPRYFQRFGGAPEAESPCQSCTYVWRSIFPQMGNKDHKDIIMEKVKSIRYLLPEAPSSTDGLD